MSISHLLFAQLLGSGRANLLWAITITAPIRSSVTFCNIFYLKNDYKFNFYFIFIYVYTKFGVYCNNKLFKVLTTSEVLLKYKYFHIVSNFTATCFSKLQDLWSDTPCQLLRKISWNSYDLCSMWIHHTSKNEKLFIILQKLPFKQ